MEHKKISFLEFKDAVGVGTDIYVSQYGENKMVSCIDSKEMEYFPEKLNNSILDSDTSHFVEFKEFAQMFGLNPVSDDLMVKQYESDPNKPIGFQYKYQNEYDLDITLDFENPNNFFICQNFASLFLNKPFDDKKVQDMANQLHREANFDDLKAFDEYLCYQFANEYENAPDTYDLVKQTIENSYTQTLANKREFFYFLCEFQSFEDVAGVEAVLKDADFELQDIKTYTNRDKEYNTFVGDKMAYAIKKSALIDIQAFNEITGLNFQDLNYQQQYNFFKPAIKQEIKYVLKKINELTKGFEYYSYSPNEYDDGEYFSTYKQAIDDISQGHQHFLLKNIYNEKNYQQAIECLLKKDDIQLTVVDLNNINFSKIEDENIIEQITQNLIKDNNWIRDISFENNYDKKIDKKIKEPLKKHYFKLIKDKINVNNFKYLRKDWLTNEQVDLIKQNLKNSILNTLNIKLTTSDLSIK